MGRVRASLDKGSDVRASDFTDVTNGALTPGPQPDLLPFQRGVLRSNLKIQHAKSVQSKHRRLFPDSSDDSFAATKPDLIVRNDVRHPVHLCALRSRTKV